MNFLILILSVMGGTCWGLILHRIADYLLAEDQTSKVLCTKAATIICAMISSTLVILFTINRIATQYQPITFIFASVLVIASITDLRSYLISRYTSLFLVPFGWLCAYMHLLPITLLASIGGSFFGYLLLYSVAHIFYTLTKKYGLGQGDIDLLAYIGAFTGPSGVWFGLLFGSLAGALVGITLIICQKAHHTTPLPFGPLLAFGALLYLFYQSLILGLIMPGHLVQ